MHTTFVDPFAFFETFPVGQSISVVGNSGSLALWQMGTEIDRRDVVIRFNECRLRTFTPQVGERTDLLITNPYVEGREKTIGIDTYPKMALVIFPHQRRGSHQALMDWLSNIPVFTTFSPRLLKVPDVPPNLSISTGTDGIYLVSRLLQPSSMLITGFSMFNAKYAPYYWSSETPPGVAKHDFPREAFVFAQLLNALNHRVEVTPEVAEVFTTTQIQMASHIRMINPARVTAEAKDCNEDCPFRNF
jgi:hypothetical protein